MQESHSDWTTLFLGVLLGMPVAYFIGILSNVHAIRFMHFRDNRKLLKKAKTRQQALVMFNRIKAFRENKRDRYPFYMILASAAVSCAIIASTLILIACIRHDFFMETRIILILFASIFLIMTVSLLAGIYETSRQIERFDDYRIEFEKRWGMIE